MLLLLYNDNNQYLKITEFNSTQFFRNSSVKLVCYNNKQCIKPNKYDTSFEKYSSILFSKYCVFSKFLFDLLQYLIFSRTVSQRGTFYLQSYVNSVPGYHLNFDILV